MTDAHIKQTLTFLKDGNREIEDILRKQGLLECLAQEGALSRKQREFLESVAGSRAVHQQDFELAGFAQEWKRAELEQLFDQEDAYFEQLAAFALVAREDEQEFLWENPDAAQLPEAVKNRFIEKVVNSKS